MRPPTCNFLPGMPFICKPSSGAKGTVKMKLCVKHSRQCSAQTFLVMDTVEHMTMLLKLAIMHRINIYSFFSNAHEVIFLFYLKTLTPAFSVHKGE